MSFVMFEIQQFFWALRKKCIKDFKIVLYAEVYKSFSIVNYFNVFYKYMLLVKGVWAYYITVCFSCNLYSGIEVSTNVYNAFVFIYVIGSM